MNYMVVGIGGIAGSIMRYLISLYTMALWAGGFPIGTFSANMAGCFSLGYLTGLNEKTGFISKKVMLGLGTGMIGSLTTFSTFSMETIQLYESGSFLMAGAYILLSAGLGLLLAGFGYLSGRKYFSKRNVK
ncbi:fluoride efflux transporter CrcB [Siminovitchia sediminis]|uniref:Fluoride-specific ion channel FluC n=1 Tax=Siminovitchia sediminis TaxID=1274353 RepID=A0ABW4KE80_9BACI